MPYQVVGKGFSWLTRAEELDSLAKGQVRWLAIQAGKLLREIIQSEGLVDTGLLQKKIGQARQVSDYVWVVPSYGDMGSPKEEAPRGTIREFIDWYRGERERERQKRADVKAREKRRLQREREAIRREEQFRPKYVRRVLTGKSKGTFLSIRELEYLGDEYSYVAETVVPRVRAATTPKGNIGKTFDFLKTMDAYDSVSYTGGRLGKTRAMLARRQLRLMRRTIRELEGEKRAFTMAYAHSERMRGQIAALYDPNIAIVRRQFGEFSRMYARAMQKGGSRRYPQGRARWESLSYSQGWWKVLRITGRELSATKTRVARAIRDMETERMRRRSKAIMQSVVTRGSRRMKKKK